MATTTWTLIPIQIMRTGSIVTGLPTTEDCNRSIDLVEFDSKEDAFHWLDSKFELSDE
jgi:hypothetical protein